MSRGLREGGNDRLRSLSETGRATMGGLRGPGTYSASTTTQGMLPEAFVSRGKAKQACRVATFPLSSPESTLVTGQRAPERLASATSTPPDIRTAEQRQTLVHRRPFTVGVVKVVRKFD